jgi:hypothetical protein
VDVNYHQGPRSGHGVRLRCIIPDDFFALGYVAPLQAECKHSVHKPWSTCPMHLPSIDVVAGGEHLGQTIVRGAARVRAQELFIGQMICLWNLEEVE